MFKIFSEFKNNLQICYFNVELLFLKVAIELLISKEGIWRFLLICKFFAKLKMDIWVKQMGCGKKNQSKWL